MFDVKPCTLEGRHVRLEYLDACHADDLCREGRDSEEWAYMPRPGFSGATDCLDWVREAQAATDQLAFAIVEKATDRAVGSSRYLAIRPPHRGLEIGWTWLGRDWQRTPVNTEAKLLLLGHAFDTLEAIRVEFKTDRRNVRSQAALERIGAVREGVLRQHMVVQEGYRRDSVYFSILDIEWPAVRCRLQEKLTRAWP